MRAAVVSATNSHSVLIHFVDLDKRVIGTLLMKAGKQVWTHLAGGKGEDESAPQMITPA